MVTGAIPGASDGNPGPFNPDPTLSSPEMQTRPLPVTNPQP